MYSRYLLSLALFSLTCLFSLKSHSQSVDIIPYGGYQFPAGADVTYNDGSRITTARLRIQGNGNYGLGVHIGLPFNGLILSASYTSMESIVTVQPFGELKEKLFDAVQDYWMFGALRKVEIDNLEPYGGVLFGWNTVRPQESIYNNASKFSVGMEAGIKYFLSDMVGIMIHGRLLMPVQWVGAGLSIGTGGSGIGISTGSTIFQGDVGGGLVIRLGG